MVMMSVERCEAHRTFRRSIALSLQVNKDSISGSTGYSVSPSTASGKLKYKYKPLRSSRRCVIHQSTITSASFDSLNTIRPITTTTMKTTISVAFIASMLGAVGHSGETN